MCGHPGRSGRRVMWRVGMAGRRGEGCKLVSSMEDCHALETIQTGDPAFHDSVQVNSSTPSMVFQSYSHPPFEKPMFLVHRKMAIIWHKKEKMTFCHACEFMWYIIVNLGGLQLMIHYLYFIKAIVIQESSFTLFKSTFPPISSHHIQSFDIHGH